MYGKDKMEFHIDNARLEIIATLNRQSHHFEELTNEIFYYNKKLGCWLSRESQLKHKEGCNFRNYNVEEGACDCAESVHKAKDRNDPKQENQHG